MQPFNALHRRDWLVASGIMGMGAAASVARPVLAQPPQTGIKQSVCRWCYSRIPLDKLAQEAAKIGYQSIELLANPDEVKTVKAAGLTCAVYGRVDIVNGFNRNENHDRLIQQLRKNIDVAAEFGLPQVICMAGNRTINGRTVNDEDGLAHCAAGLKRIIGHAEAKKVTILMEGLNSKRDHKDYMYDKTTWGVELCKRIGSDRFKLLYDIYHMQIMEGDVIATIRQFKDYIGHYHTGGVPGRNEIDETQELHYPAIVKAIRDTGYQGYLGQEFIPKRDPIASMGQAFRICT